MSKVICDVCGTAYPETATQCPICGSAKQAGEQTAAADAAVVTGEDTSYTYVKGGRFSKRNVRLRNQKGSKPQERRSTARGQLDNDEDGTNKGLIVVVIVLLLAIVAVVIYIGVRFFAQPSGNTNTGNISTSQSSTEEQTEEQTQGETELKIPCTALEVLNPVLEFHAADDTWPMNVVCTPENTTDAIVYSSADETVATVSETGRITAVGSGETVITVTCGEVTAQCKVICIFAGANQPTEAPTDPSEPVDSNFKFAFRWATYDEETGKYDVTISNEATWQAYKNDLSVDPSEITWTSDDPSVCTVENGIVTVKAKGKTEIHAQYGGQTFTCIVRCTWKETAAENTETDEPAEEGGFEFNTPFKDAEKWDTTLELGKTWRAYKTDSGIKPEDVIWTIDDTTICKIENGVITAIGAGKTELHAQYNGKTYTCIVRVTG